MSLIDLVFDDGLGVAPLVVLLLVVFGVYFPELLNLLVLLPDEVAEVEILLLLLALLVQVYQVDVVEVLVHNLKHLHLIQGVLRHAGLVHYFTHFVEESQLVHVDVGGGLDAILQFIYIELLCVLVLQLVYHFHLQSGLIVFSRLFFELTDVYFEFVCDFLLLWKIDDIRIIIQEIPNEFFETRLLIQVLFLRVILIYFSNALVRHCHSRCLA